MVGRSIRTCYGGAVAKHFGRHGDDIWYEEHFEIWMTARL